MDTTLGLLLRGVLGDPRAEDVLEVLAVPAHLLAEQGPKVPRGVIAYALNAILMDDLLKRVPSASAYVEDLRRENQTLTFDHGALRTVAFPQGGTGALPPGEAAFRRILEPLGYRRAGHYPLDALRMTGRAYAHIDLPEDIPQFFVSELHVERFSSEFQEAARRIFGAAQDPLAPDDMRRLADLATRGDLSFADALQLTPALAAAFTRTHPDPGLADYQTLLRESPEAAWIATEGSAFNHVTDRVGDLDRLVVRQRALDRPMKATIEVSRSGRVRQTAYLADPVTRRFETPDGPVDRVVPGSFYEFIERGLLPVDDVRPRLDLAFDTGNAQGIFKMTA